jgi:hypothetical protein
MRYKKFSLLTVAQFRIAGRAEASAAIDGEAPPRLLNQLYCRAANQCRVTSAVGHQRLAPPIASTASCPLRSESDRRIQLPRNDATCQ